jgi:hypothetical protein
MSRIFSRRRQSPSYQVPASRRARTYAWVATRSARDAKGRRYCSWMRRGKRERSAMACFMITRTEKLRRK